MLSTNMVVCIELAYSYTEKQRARGKLARQDTSMKFDNASNAMRRYESKDIQPLSEDEDEDEGK